MELGCFAAAGVPLQGAASRCCRVLFALWSGVMCSVFFSAPATQDVPSAAWCEISRLLVPFGLLSVTSFATKSFRELVHGVHGAVLGSERPWSHPWSTTSKKSDPQQGEVEQVDICDLTGGCPQSPLFCSVFFVRVLGDWKWRMPVFVTNTMTTWKWEHDVLQPRNFAVP